MLNFSGPAPDEDHEQNNEKIRGHGGATALLNRPDSTCLQEERRDFWSRTCTFVK